MSTLEQDLILLKGIAAEDKGSIEQLYRQYYIMVQSMVLANAGNNDDAADLFQETIIVLYEKNKKGKF